jgi:hypothetical protein
MRTIPSLMSATLKLISTAEALVGQPQVGRKLLFVNRGQRFDRFYLHDHSVFNDQVGPETDFYPDVLVDHRD